MRTPFRSRARVWTSATLLALALGFTTLPRPLRAEPLQWSRWPMPAPRTSFVAGYDQVGNRLLIYGGFGTGPAGYNTETWALTLGAAPRWSLLDDGGLGVAQSVFAEDAAGNREFVLGGQNEGVQLTGVSHLDLDAGSWTLYSPTGPPPSLNYSDLRSAVYDASRNRLVILGSQSHGDSYVFDPATSVWSTRSNTGTVPLDVGKFAVYDPVRDRFIVSGSGGMYQVATGTFAWTLLTPETQGNALIYDAARDRIEAVTTTGVVWAMSMDTPPVWTQLSSSTPPGATWGYDTPVVHDTQADRLVVHSGSSTSNATWGYSLVTNTWNLVEAGAPLEGRRGHSSVVVPPWNAVVNFGGMQSNASVSRFALDGTAGFQSVATAGTPPAGRYAHAAIYDPVRARMLVFGGTNSIYLNPTTGSYFNDVYTLSIGPSPTWTKLVPTGAPPDPRGYCEAVYDPIRDRMLVFGGFNASVNSFRDLWALSLSGAPAWTRLFDNGTSPQMPELNPYGEAIVYDSRHDRVVVMATENASTLKAWYCPLTGPPGWTAFAGSATDRMFFDAAYDSLNDRVIAFGGTKDPFGDAMNALTTLSFPSGAWGGLPGPPYGRFDHTFVRDAVHGRFVAMDGKEVNAGEGSWPGSVWFLNDLAASAGVPPARTPDILALASCRLVAADRVSISADVPGSGPITLEVFDVLGRRWGRSQETVAAGGRREFTVPLDAAASPGLYFVRAVQGTRSARAKLVAVF